MRLNPLFAFCTAAVFAGACDPEGNIDQTPVPVAGLRYVNVVSDTAALNFRVVDVVAYAPVAINAGFRTGGSPQGLPTAFLPPHLPVAAGTRRIKVFNFSTDPAVATQELLDTTYTFQANTNYTVYLFGFARTGQTPALEALITIDAPPAVAAGNFAIRTLNLAPGLDTYATTPVDVFVAARGGAALAGPSVDTNTAFAGLTPYENVAVGTYKGAVTATGTLAPVLFQANMPTGIAGTSTVNPIAGTLVAGTAITAVIVPRSVPGSIAPFSFTNIREITSITSNVILGGGAAADTTATVVTAAPHGLTTGDTVAVGGAVSAPTNTYNRSAQVTVVDPTTFTYRLPAPSVSPAGGNHKFWLRSREAPAFNGLAIASITSVGTAATVTTLASHGLATNDIVTIRGAPDAPYNGTFAVTVTGGTGFTYTTNGTPAASPASGPAVLRRAENDYTAPFVVFVIDRDPPRTAP